MSWLLSQVLTSLFGAIIIVKIYDTVVGGILVPMTHAVRTTLFVGAWTAITTASGMRGLRKAARGLRKK